MCSDEANSEGNPGEGPLLIRERVVEIEDKSGDDRLVLVFVDRQAAKRARDQLRGEGWPVVP